MNCVPTIRSAEPADYEELARLVESVRNEALARNRGYGIGPRLKHLLHETARAQGHTQILTQNDETNVGGAKLNERMGYRLASRLIQTRKSISTRAV